MLKKYELVKFHYSIKDQLKMDKLVEYIEKTFTVDILKDHFLTFCLTFFFCNCVANLKMKTQTDTAEFYIKHVNYIYAKLYKTIDDGSFLPKINDAKIANDIRHILDNHMIIKINSFYYNLKKLYVFFFQQNIYIVEKI